VSFLDRIRECAAPDLSLYMPFRVDGETVGWIKPDFAGRLGAFGDVFDVSDDAVSLASGLDGFDARTAAVDGVLRELHGRGLIGGWRDEAYPVGHSFSAPPLFNIERAAAHLLGILAYGIHVNGYVPGNDGGDEGGNDGLGMWVGKRALDKPTAPGKLDQIVAGGQPAGLSLGENLVKESAEEANIPAGLAATAVPVGAVSYMTERPEGLRRDVLFIYDLEVPADFTPENTDGEIEEFYLWPIEKVFEKVRDTDDFKFNCALVNIDFLIRRGLIKPDHPDYIDLLRGLRG